MKRLLGRDSLTYEVKNVHGVNTFTPKCQVLFVSNLAPEQFVLLASDEAFMEKIIPVQYEQTSTLAPEHQIPGLRSMLDRYIPELLNWAALAPMRNIQFTVRAMRYRAIKDRHSNSKGSSFCDFLMETFWHNPNKSEIIPFKALKEALTAYAETTGDEVIQAYLNAEKRYFGKTASDFFKGILRVSFGVEVEYRRAPSNVKGRPYGLDRLQWRYPEEIDPPPGCYPLVLNQKFKEEELALHPAFYVENGGCIAWIQPTSLDINKVQKQILESRKERKLLSAAKDNSTPGAQEEVVDLTPDVRKKRALEASYDEAKTEPTTKAQPPPEVKEQKLTSLGQVSALIDSPAYAEFKYLLDCSKINNPAGYNVIHETYKL